MEIAFLIIAIIGLLWGFYIYFKPSQPKPTAIEKKEEDKPLDISNNFIVPHRRNALLKHEEEWINQIHQHLTKDGKAVVGQDVALTGQGGLGKTAMAVEYACRYSENYPGGVFWLQMDQGLGSAAQRFIETASKFGIDFGSWENQSEADVCLQKVLDKSGIKIREGFRFQIPFSGRLSNL